MEQVANVISRHALGKALLMRDDLPDPVRAQLQSYIQLIRARLECWILQFVPETMAVTAS